MAGTALELSEEDAKVLKKGLARLRKAREDKPVGFCYCQEGEGGPGPAGGAA